MIHIAIIEDDLSDRDRLVKYLECYEAAHQCRIVWTAFANGEEFLLAGRKDFDLIFMDIELGGINGIETARRIRAYDEATIIVLITNLMQYAIQGYSVRAADYIMKPLDFKGFSVKMDALCRMVQTRQQYITVKAGRDYRKYNISSITYIEVYGHQLYVHTREKKEKVSDTLAQMEELLVPYGFAKCNKCYLVNLEYVDGIVGDCVEVAGEMLKISRRKKSEFIHELTRFVKG